jgi:hypothetical protein
MSSSLATQKPSFFADDVKPIQAEVESEKVENKLP